MRHTITVWLVHIIVYAVNTAPVIHSPLTAGYAVLAVVAQASLMCLPMFCLAAMVNHARKKNLSNRWLTLSKFLQPIIGISLLVLLYANYTLDGMYGFFIDPFVVNLLTLDGGVSALGATSTFYFTVVRTIGAIILGYFIILKIAALKKPFRYVDGIRGKFSLVLLAIFSTQGATYALAEYKSYVPILAVSDRIAWYLPVTGKSLLEDLGVERSREVMYRADSSSDDGFNYPNSIENTLPLDKNYNIVWLVAESWRWDMLDPKIMPATWKFAQRSQRFLQHYSTGNGTRMGIFGQFYGLNGQFWFPALKFQRSPLLIDVLQESNYELEAYTSASFTYPEFDKTVWLNFPKEDLHSHAKGLSWERDRDNVTDLLEFARKARSPFFAFMFFESTHANYNFPIENEIKKAYLENFDYLSADLDSSIDLIKNRYVNSSNHLDTQFARVFEQLEQQGVLDDTIVIVTGDHGEEFMENGRWGHNSTFSQQQIRVPLLIHIPGRKGELYSAMTSHLDLPATVLSALKSGTKLEEFSMGKDLLSPTYNREFAVVSDWHGDALVTDKYKFSMSVKANMLGRALSGLEDAPVTQGKIPSEVASALTGYLAETRRFRQPGSQRIASSLDESGKSLL